MNKSLNYSEDFLAQYPQSTQRVYSAVLREFSQITKPEKATVADLLEYQRRIKDQAPSTVSRKIATLSSLYDFLGELGVRTDNPTKALRRPTVDPQRSIRWLTPVQTERLLEAASDDPRLLAIVWCGLHSLRVSEIVGLDVEDFRSGMLRVLAKGNRTHWVPLIEPAQAAIINYLGDRTKGPIFLGRSGRISVRRVQYLIDTLSEKIGYRISPHALRHTFGTTAIKSGNSTMIVQSVMGHRSPKTTEKYVHLDDSDKRAAIERTFGHLDISLRVIQGGKEIAS